MAGLLCCSWASKRWTLLCFAAIAVIIPLQVDGWGKEGHEIVANLAYARLSRDTQTVVKDILRQSDGSYGEDDKAGSPLASVANWADHLRSINAFHWSAPLHYVDIQDQAIDGGCPCSNDTITQTPKCHFVYDRDCVKDICVAGAILNFTHQLSDWTPPSLLQSNRVSNLLFVLRGSSNKLIREALMFLVHFVGDIHQPLHSARASDKGGNEIHVHFPSSPNTRIALAETGNHPHHKSLNLHSVWDAAIIERAIDDIFSGSRKEMEDDLTDLIRNSTTSKWLDCADGSTQVCVNEWAEESFQDALEWAYRNVDGNEVIDGSVLDDMYYQTRLLVVRHRLAAAAVRLAATLESVLGTLNPTFLV
jgi:hypothetical protein